MIVFRAAFTLLVGLASAKAVKRQEPEQELFLSLSGRGADTISVSQCDELEISFGGGLPPYTFGVWTEDQQTVTTGISIETTGRTAQSQLVVVSPGTESCYESIPVLRTGNQPSSTGSTNLVSGSLQDCRQNGPATCKFTVNSQSGTYAQQTLMGNIFANCNSAEPVRQTFTGSVTVTDNWSTGANAVFGPPSNRIRVFTEISRGESRTITQSFEWEIKPGQQTALVAIARFNGIYGGMDLSYSNGTKAHITDAVYFQSTGDKATVTRLDIGCGESWPTWNATTEINGSTTRRGH
ncbi:unnamed protein product, partial [Rhizoctonia solani]